MAVVQTELISEPGQNSLNFRSDHNLPGCNVEEIVVRQGNPYTEIKLRCSLHGTSSASLFVLRTPKILI